MARPTALTPEVREQLEDALAARVPVRIAAASARISRASAYEWI